MSSFTTISVDKLARLIGTPQAPDVVDVRTEEDFAADPRLIPGAVRRPATAAADWASALARPAGRDASASSGRKLSEGAAAWLRQVGGTAEALAGGFEAWARPACPWCPMAKLPPRDRQGRTVWVTRARPKIDRIACPWLIRRFVDPGAVFLFVAPAEVDGRGRPVRRDAVRHRERVLEPPRRGLHLRRDGGRVRARHRAAAAPGADRPRRRHRAARSRARKPRACSPFRSACRACTRDDLAQLEAGMALYDALYRWCRDATDETHNWPTNKPAA